MLQAFMDEKNIRWAELLSGALIVVSAVGLVVRLRATLRETIPYFPALSFMLVSLAAVPLFDESLTPGKLAGLTLIVVGLTLISRG